MDFEHFGNLEFYCSIQDFIFLLSANGKLLMHAIFNHITPIQFTEIEFLKTKANIRKMQNPLNPSYELGHYSLLIY